MFTRRDRSVALGVARRGIKILFTNPAIFVPSIIFPLFFLAAFSGGLSRLIGVPGFNFPVGYTAFIYVFVVVQAAGFGGVFTGFAAARDIENGFTRRLMLAAPNRRSIILGYAITALVRGIFSGTVVTAAAFIGGMEIASSRTQVLGLAALAVLMNQAAVLWALGIAFRFRTIQAGPLMQIPIFLLLFMSPVYVPFDLLEGWLQSIARFDPVTYMVEAGRGFVSGDNTDVLLAFSAGLAMVSLLFLWALRSLRRAEVNP